MRQLRLVVLTGLLTLGCGDGPLEPLGSTYALESIANEPLPAPFQDNATVTILVLESTLEFTSPTRGEERTRRKLILTADPNPGVTEQTLPFHYVVNGNEVAISYDCPDLATCIAGPHLSGRVVKGKLVFDHSLGKAPLVYCPD